MSEIRIMDYTLTTPKRDSDTRKGLIGAKIVGIYMRPDQQAMVLDTNRGYYAFLVQGECCSESWFADITGVQALIGGTLKSVEEISMDGYNVMDGRCRQDEDQAYGYKFTTNKGYADIVFRNSSNGFYGGKMIQTDEDPINNWETLDRWEKVTDDWSA